MEAWRRERYGGDLAWVVGPASLKFEYDAEIDHRNGLGPGGSDLDAVRVKGWYVSGTYLLTGEERVFNGPVVPRRPLNPIGDEIGLGAWELGIRFAELKFSSDDAQLDELLVRQLSEETIQLSRDDLHSGEPPQSR